MKGYEDDFAVCENCEDVFDVDEIIHFKIDGNKYKIRYHLEDKDMKEITSFENHGDMMLFLERKGIKPNKGNHGNDDEEDENEGNEKLGNNIFPWNIFRRKKISSRILTSKETFHASSEVSKTLHMRSKFIYMAV